MGTPQFAAVSLGRLITSKHEIIAVYTMPPKPAGRGHQDTRSQVHKLADKHFLNILTPKNFKDEEVCKQFEGFKADIAIVVAYGMLLPGRILNAPKHGCINIHISKLPRWRGAAPIQHTILAGDKETSVCIMKMDKGLDTGDIMLEHELKVDDDMTASKLHDITADIGADMIVEVLRQIETGTVNLRKQSEIGATYARKIERVDEKLDFNKSAYLVNAQIRTFSPRPGAYFSYLGENIKIIEATIDETFKTDAKPGTVIDSDLTIACGSGVLRPNLLQREGRKMIYRDAFLRGFGIPKGVVLS